MGAGKKYRFRAVAWCTGGGGYVCSKTAEATYQNDGGTGYSPTSQFAGVASGTLADLEAVAVAFTRSGLDVRVTCTGVAPYTLTWGAKIDVIELPDA
jgi:hypothetical protein